MNNKKKSYDWTGVFLFIWLILSCVDIYSMIEDPASKSWLGISIWIYLFIDGFMVGSFIERLVKKL